MEPVPVQLSKNDIIAIYQESTPAGKEKLEEKFGRKTFNRNINIADRIWTVDDACVETGRPIEEVRPFANPSNAFQDWLNACGEMAVLIEAFNEGKVPDWADPKQKKYIAWWDMRPESGFGLSFRDVDFVNSRTCVASRLHLLKEDHHKLIAERFPDICKRYMTKR
ncbi:MAG TPA: hypothetical protein VK644_01570 [Chitinophagaceae bacterium]|nr:hypothetical protein [Chitinophagaceae bacterium]